MTNDITLERIWDARRKIYAHCGNDPQKLVEYYIEQQKQNPHRFRKNRRKPSRGNGKYDRKTWSPAAAENSVAR